MAGDQKFWKDGLVWEPLDGDGSSKFWKDGLAYASLETALSGIAGTAGIPSAEAFGSDGAVNPQQLDGVTGIASAEAFGSGGLIVLTIEGAAGIASAEAFGADGVLATLAGSAGIASAEAFGAAGIVQTNIEGAAGIPSAEVFGDGSNVPAGVSLVLESGVPGIASAEAFGSGGSLFSVVSGVAGIRSAEAFGRSGVVVNLNAAASPFGIYIDGENKTNYLRTNGVKVDEQLNFNSAATITLVDEANSYTPSVGESVIVLHLPEGYTEWQRIFAGSVESVHRDKVPGPDRTETFYELRCVDHARALSRRRVSKKFSQGAYGSLTSIMVYFAENFLAPEGITWIDRGDPGIVIPDLEFSGTPLNEAFGTLAELTGWDWAIDYYQNLYFYDRPAYVQNAPIDLTEDTTGPNSETWYDLTITTDRGLYRNRQLVKSSQAASTTENTREYVVPLNTTVPYTLFWNGYLLVDGEFDGKVAAIQEVRLNGTPVPFYTTPDTPPSGWVFRNYTPGSLSLQYNSPSFAALPNGTVVAIDFTTNNDLPEPIFVENSAEIAARKAIESGTGIYEDVYDAGDITDPDTLEEIALQLLARFSTMGREISCGSDVYGYMPGQEILVNLPSRGVSSSAYVIEAVTKEEVAKTLLRYKLRISNRIQQRDALTAMDRLVKRLRKPSKLANANIQFELAKTLPGVINPGLVTGTALGNTYVVRYPITLKDVALYFKTAPTGTSIIVDIKRNGTSIFPSGFSCEYPAGTSGLVTYASFAGAPLTLAKNDLITIDVLQVGSTVPGKDGTVTLNGWA